MTKYIIILLTALLFSCNDKPVQMQKMVVEGEAQGTTYRIVYLTNNGSNYQRGIDSLLIEIDNSLSTYQPNSVISKLNQSEKEFKVDKMFIDVFNAAKDVYRRSDGAFNPALAPIVNAFGFGFMDVDGVDSLMIDSLLKLTNFNEFALEKNIVFKSHSKMMLDFNAIAQGYSVDVLCNYLEKKGVENYMVEVGGELKVKGHNLKNTLWRIGIDKPIENMQERELKAIVNLENSALATSGNYRKFYEKDGVKYSHTINPKTGYPIRHKLLSATVITDDCAMADAYATVFMVIGLEKSKEMLSNLKFLEAILIYTNDKGEFETFITPKINEFIELDSTN